jgi:hypothetical protein
MTRKRSRWLSAFGLVAPILLVKSMGYFQAAPGPAETFAEELEETAPEPLAPTLHTVESRRWPAATEHATSLRARTCGPSPFLVTADASTDAEPAEVSDTIVPETSAIEPPPVVVQMIMNGREGPVALIAAKPRRVGDAVDAKGEWIVKDIDPATRVVRIAHVASGMVTTIGVATP